MSAPHEPDAMTAEFDTLAEWTAQAAMALGPEHHVPAGCRGTGHPAAFDWLLERLDAGRDTALADIGAGVGGAATYAAQKTGSRPVLFEPAAGACRAAARLFDHPVVRADAASLPVATGSVHCAWSLGVLCTTSDHLTVLGELRRILRPDARAGLLVFVAAHDDPPGEPEGNHFPAVDSLHATLGACALEVVDETAGSSLSRAPRRWTELADDVTSYVREHHGDTQAWRAAAEESAAVGRLIADGSVFEQLLVVRPRG